VELEGLSFRDTLADSASNPMIINRKEVSILEIQGCVMHSSTAGGSTYTRPVDSVALEDVLRLAAAANQRVVSSTGFVLRNRTEMAMQRKTLAPGESLWRRRETLWDSTRLMMHSNSGCKGP